MITALYSARLATALRALRSPSADSCVNRRDGWLDDEPRRRIARTQALLVGETASAKESEALIGLVRGLPIERKRKVAIERPLTPPQPELALGV